MKFLISSPGYSPSAGSADPSCNLVKWYHPKIFAPEFLKPLSSGPLVNHCPRSWILAGLLEEC